MIAKGSGLYKTFLTQTKKLSMIIVHRLSEDKALGKGGSKKNPAPYFKVREKNIPAATYSPGSV